MLKPAKEIVQITKSVVGTKKRLEYVLNFIGTHITEAAENGEWSITCSAGCIESYKSLEDFKADNLLCGIKTASFEKKDFPFIGKYLLDAGYDTCLQKTGDSYVPAGLRDDYDGSGPLYKNVCLVISWKDAK